MMSADDMALDVADRRSLGYTDLLRTWQRLGLRSRDDDVWRSSPLELYCADLASIPRSTHEADTTAALLVGDCSVMHNDGSSGQDYDSSEVSSASFASCSSSGDGDPPGFIFSTAKDSAGPLDFNAIEIIRLQPGIKRPRNGQDVDGPLTATLACKKRRIRVDLITSRLSQPYSQPATHILNREGKKVGDERFSKMAMSLDLARRITHLHATSFLRFSVMNRARKRLALGKPGDAEALTLRMSPTKEPSQLTQSWQAAASAKYLRPPSLSSSAAATPSSPLALPPDRPVPPAHRSAHPSHPPPKALACRMSKPAALPLLSADMGATQNRTSPRIHPVRSPERYEDDAEEDSFAFLHFDDDVGVDGADDPDNVYSDFSVIFGGGGGSPESQSGDDHSYEEYLDELDGISWVR